MVPVEIDIYLLEVETLTMASKLCTGIGTEDT